MKHLEEIYNNSKRYGDFKQWGSEVGITPRVYINAWTYFANLPDSVVIDPKTSKAYIDYTYNLVTTGDAAKYRLRIIAGLLERYEDFQDEPDEACPCVPGKMCEECESYEHV